jgi:hypothetical protein
MQFNTQQLENWDAVAGLNIERLFNEITSFQVTKAQISAMSSPTSQARPAIVS